MRAATPWIAAIVLAGVSAPAVAAEGPTGSYAGQQARSIKALSDDDIAALQSGDGMGMAKPAELNGYPGPRHVLALAHELHLTDAQVNRVTAIRDRMGAAAKPLGAELIEHERMLDQLFSEAEITPERLTSETAAIGDIQGRLRAVHLAAHMETRAVLSPEQVLEYDTLRGYAKQSTSGHRPGSGHHHD